MSIKNEIMDKKPKKIIAYNTKTVMIGESCIKDNNTKLSPYSTIKPINNLKSIETILFLYI